MTDETVKETRSRTLNRLSARAVETVTWDESRKSGMHVDGGGLFLRVSRDGSKKWLFRFMSPATGKRREMGLGRADKGFVSLAAAREAAGKARDLVAKNIDPIDDAERQKQERLAEAKKGKPKTFGEFADEWLDQNELRLSNPKHRAQWRTTLGAKPKQDRPERTKTKKAKPRKGAVERSYAAPLRAKSLAEITTEDVLSVLKPLWNEVPETAKRTQGRIEKIMDAASAKGLYHGPNPARWRRHLDQMLLARPKRSKGHHAALPHEEIPAFITALRGRLGIAARALEFLILTAARSGEVRGMTWGELDLDRARWTVPAARMKAGKEHRVPLCKRALAILEEMARFRPAGDDGSGLVFPGDEASGRRKPDASGPVQMSDMTLAAVLKRMGHTDITVHGFRSTFQDWAEEVARYPASAVEAALAHVIGGTRASYRRGDSYDMRTELMAVWETYLDSGIAPGNVLPFAVRA